MTTALNIDLHCHSTRSDGTLAPADVVRRAHRNGVQVLALTDHDILDGVPEAARMAAQLGLMLVPGVEVSITWASETVHIVGLRVDPDDATLQAGLAANRSGRDGRAREMACELEKAGVPDAYEGAMRYVGNPALISRSHFARYLIQIGRAVDTRDVFANWLVEGKPGYVPQRWASLQQAVDWIRAAGGQAVLAHPSRYRFDETALWELARAFVDAGGEGIEVVSGSHGEADIHRFADWSRRLPLAASRGSDFHDPAESRFDLGRVPPLPKGLRPIWADWPDLPDR
ncbi:MAG: 3',5'-nucleoside bisphosphate phosphatase [Lautropia sp.]|nr:3',5'-nucleoside bisphosphate phosphatase [Lautropia sp.]